MLDSSSRKLREIILRKFLFYLIFLPFCVLSDKFLFEFHSFS